VWVSKMSKYIYYFIIEAKNRNPYFMRLSAIRLGYIMAIIGTFLEKKGGEGNG